MLSHPIESSEISLPKAKQLFRPSTGFSFFQYKNSKVRRFWLSLLARSERLRAEKQKKLSGKAEKGVKEQHGTRRF